LFSHKSVYQNCLKLRHVSGQRGVLRWSYGGTENRNTELTGETPAACRCMEAPKWYNKLNKCFIKYI